MIIREAVLLTLTLLATVLLFTPFLWLLGIVAYNGALTIIKAGPSFLIKEPPLPESNSLGGIGTVLEGSLFLVATATAIAAPLSVISALYIVIYENSPLAKLGKYLLELVVEFPTIVVGISVFLFFGLILGLGLSSLTASIALAIIMLPYATVQITEALRIPKSTVYEAAASLGLNEAHVTRIMLIEGKRGVVTGILIGMAKIFGETAPLLFTTTTSFNLYVKGFLSPVSAIPVLIFNYAFSPYDNWHDTAWGASLVLSIIVLSIYLAVKLTLARGGRS